MNVLMIVREWGKNREVGKGGGCTPSEGHSRMSLRDRTRYESQGAPRIQREFDSCQPASLPACLFLSNHVGSPAFRVHLRYDRSQIAQIVYLRSLGWIFGLSSMVRQSV